MKRRTAAAVISVALAISAARAADGATDGSADADKPRLVILNFKSDWDGGDLGGRIGYALRSKLRRSQRFDIPEELDFEELDTGGEARPTREDIGGARKAAAVFEPRFVAWGEVTQNEGYHIRLSAMDLAGEGRVISLEKKPAGLRQVALDCGALADELARAFTGEGYLETYPSKSTEGWLRVGDNLVKNGDFEKGDSSPEHWEKVDGLCSFWEKDPQKGRYIRMDSDVYLSQWKKWRAEFEGGAPASAAPAKTPTSGPKYNTVGGTYGVHLYSDGIPVKQGATYSIEFDARGLTAGTLFFPKVFVKGYGEAGPSMEMYRMYKAVKPERGDRWQHFSRVFSPTARTPGVKTMKVMLFAYWPPGEYAFDNLEIYEVTRAQGTD